jgi:hypothetical protein
MKRSPLTLAAFGLALALASGFSLAEERKPAEVSKAVEKRYSELQSEFTTAVSAYQKAAEEARAAKTKVSAERPHTKFAPRYAELAHEGHPRAARWCLDFIGDTSAVEFERRELFLACEAQLVPHVLWADVQQAKEKDKDKDKKEKPPEYGVRDLARSVGGSAALLGNEKALALLQELFDKAVLPESKAQALNAQVTVHMTGVARDAATPAEVLALYGRLSKDFGETDTGKRAAGQLFRLEHLQLGMTAPDFATQDVEGVAFNLSDYRGKVVVLDFWGFW